MTITLSDHIVESFFSFRRTGLEERPTFSWSSINARRLRMLAFLLLYTLTSVAFSQGWRWVSPVPTGDHCRSVCFVDSLQGWILAGGSGVIVHTRDGGMTWDYQDTGVRTFYNDVIFVDSSYGWVGGGTTDFVLSRTTNGGRSWLTTIISADSIGRPVFPIKTLRFLGRDTGFAASGYEVFRTTNQGDTWTGLLINGRPRSVAAMWFLNAETGFVLCDALYKTSDCGATWTIVNTEIANDASDMFFRDTLNGWRASTATGLARTTDGGKSWEAQTGRLSLASLSFPEPGRGWAFGGEGIYSSIDSGKTWQQQSTIPNLEKGRMISSLNGFAVGVFGGIFQTKTGGSSWDSLGSRVTSITLYAVYMMDRQRVWTVGGDGSHGEVLFSSDGGTSWKKQVAQSQYCLRSITFSDPLTGWISGEQGAMLRSSDGGLSWQAWPSPFNATLFGVVFKDANHGWCAGSGVIPSTTDGGNSWKIFQVPNGDDVRSLCMVNTNTGWAVGGSVNDQRGLILHTTDAGVSWSTQFSDLVNPFLSVAFEDSLNGWVTGDIVMKTSDAGVTWQEYPWTYSFTPEFAFFVDRKVGWMASPFGEFVNTSDGGTSWSLQKSPTSGPILSLVAQEDGTGFAVGIKSILKTTTGGLDWVDPVIASELATTLSLSQNYPNPFNPSTTIRYDLPHRSRVRIGVYNVLGEKIQELVDEVKDPGRHEVKFVGSNLASGVYFYRAFVGESVEIRKMLLVK